MLEENALQLTYVQANQCQDYVLVLQIFNVVFQKVILVLPTEKVESVFQHHPVLERLFLVFVPVLLIYDAVLPIVVHPALQMSSVEVMLVQLLVQSKAMVV
jgi:hypothetical protein